MDIYDLFDKAVRMGITKTEEWDENGEIVKVEKFCPKMLVKNMSDIQREEQNYYYSLENMFYALIRCMIEWWNSCPIDEDVDFYESVGKLLDQYESYENEGHTIIHYQGSKLKVYGWLPDRIKLTISDKEDTRECKCKENRD